MKTKFTFVNCDDWAALDIDGKLALQDHRIRPEVLLDCLYPNEVNSVWVSQEVAENGLPELLEDLEAYDE